MAKTTKPSSEDLEACHTSRKRCTPSLSNEGQRCLSELKELLGIATDSGVIEHCLYEVRYSAKMVSRQCRMTLSESLRASTDAGGSLALVTCLMQSAQQSGQDPK